MTPRLALIAETVRASSLSLGFGASVVADIGTDHAKLPVYLVNHGICSYAYAADLRKMPLNAAKENIDRLCSFPERIQTVLSDGFDRIPRTYNIVVVAGMGGELIADILERGQLESRVVLVLSPMTAAEDLRQYLYEHCYQISSEKIAREKEKLYTVMQAEKVQQKVSYDIVDCFVSGALSKTLPDPDTAAYIQKYIQKQNKIIAGKSKAGCFDEQYAAARTVKARLEALLKGGI